MSVEICAVWVTQRQSTAFLKSVKQKSIFSQTFEWQEILRRKTNKSYEMTHEIIKKSCKLDSEKCHA